MILFDGKVSFRDTAQVNRLPPKLTSPVSELALLGLEVFALARMLISHIPGGLKDFTSEAFLGRCVAGE
jgi:hypothetical protein